MGLPICLILSLCSLLLGCKPTAPPAESGFADLVLAESGAVESVVLAAQSAASQSSRVLVVYVGAKWCEPCRIFLGAVHDKTLPKELSKLRFLKFDHDKDEQRLIEAGYGGQMIPRFVMPGSDGRGSELRFEGSSKGPEAIDNIIPRLKKILAKS